MNRPRDPAEVVSDERLLSAYATGDGSGLDELVQRYADELYQFVLRYVRDPACAEDVVQETFLQVHHSAATFDPERRFRPWLFTIAVNKARDQLRGRQRKREVPLASGTSGGDAAGGYLDFLSDDGPAPSDGLEVEERRRLVRQVIEAMPPSLREILILAYFHRFPYKELAEVLAIPLGTVKSRLHAAVADFARAYAKAEASLHGVRSGSDRREAD